MANPTSLPPAASGAPVAPRAPNPAPRKRPWLSPALLLLGTLVWFAPALFLGKTLLSFDERIVPPFVQDRDDSVATRPQNLITSDLQGWILAHDETAVARLKRRELPLWDPSELLGRPLHADASFPTFYLPDAIHLLMPAVQAYAWSMAIHVLWAALGMLLLLRRAGLREPAALLGAVAFGFSGWMLVHLHIPHFVRSAAWLPWMLLASLRLAAQPGARRAVVLALAVGAAALAAYPPILGVMLFGLAACALAAVVRSSARARAAVWHAIAVAVGLSLGGASLLPIAELRAQSLRAKDVTEEMARQKSLRPAHLISLAAPDFQGNPVALRSAGYPTVESYPVAREFFAVEVQDNYVEDTLYGGVLALLLALVAIGGAPKRAETWGFLGLFALGLLIAVHTPLQKVLREQLVPGLGSGSPKRALLLSAFGLAGLAAIGCDAMLQVRALPRWLLGCAAVALAGMLAVGWWASLHEMAWWGGGIRVDDEKRMKRLLAAAFALPLVLALAGGALAQSFREDSIARRIALGALVLILAGDLFVFGWRFNPFQPPEARGARTPVIDLLTRPENEGRTARLMERNLLPASIVSQWGVKSVDGIQALLVREVAELLQHWQPGCIDPANPNQVHSFGDVKRFGLPIFDLLARWVVWNKPPPEELGFVQRYASEREGLALSENPRALPAVFFADRVCVIPDREQRLAALMTEEFAPARVAVVDSRVDVTGLPTGILVEGVAAPAEPPPASTVAATRVDPETFVVRVFAPTAGILVVNEAFFPGWRIEESDTTRAAIRVDHAFLGVPLAAGGHDLVIRYVPVSFKIGAALSIGAATLLALLALFAPRARA